MKAAGSLAPATLLATLPAGLRDELFNAFNETLRNYREMRWEPSELNGGKLCEVSYSILKGHVDGTFPATSNKPANMFDACLALEKHTSFSRSIRIQIPRVLVALYEVRNNRGVGHTGGDVNPNHMDATAVVYMSKWVLAELVRVFHNVDTSTATAAIDEIVDRELQIIWNVGTKRRVLDTSLCMKDKMMVLLYGSRGTVAEKDIVEWLEHSNPSVFRRDVIKPAHKHKLIEYDSKAATIVISPKGIVYVETNIELTWNMTS